MIAIGIRVKAQIIYFSIIEQKDEHLTVLRTDKLVIPQALLEADKLNYIRKTFLDIIVMYGVTRAGLRMLENNGRRIDQERVAVEAIIQELFSCSPIEKYYGGGIGKVSKLLRLNNNGAFNKYVKGVDLPDYLLFIKDNSQIEREVLLTSLASLNL